MKYIMGLDIGTTGCKVHVFDQDGTVCASAYREYLDRQHDGLMDAEGVWEEVCSAIAECAEVYPQIEAICTTSFGETVVPVDAEGKALGAAILYTNANAAGEWRELDRAVGGARIAEITGHISHPMYTINRLIWIKKNQKELYDKTAAFLFVAGYIERKLGADCVAENTLAARSMAYDVRRESWSEEICRAAGIDLEKLPRIVRAGEEIGRVSAELAARLGLEGSPAILAGGHDQPCVALGMGAIHGGDVSYGMGTAECFTLVLDEFRQSPDMQEAHLVCAPHVAEGKFLTYGVLFSGGIVLSDLRNKLYGKERADADREGWDVYERMMEEMPDWTEGLYYLPHLAGTGTPQMDTEDKGVICGMTLNTARGELVRAALEGISFDMRLNVENMERCGLEVKRILAAGGGAKSEKGVQVRSDILQRPILRTKDVQAGTRGVYYIAARALGWIDSYETGIREPEGVWSEPKAKPEAVERKYRNYLALYERTKGVCI